MIDGMLAIDAHTHVTRPGGKWYGKWSFDFAPERMLSEMNRNGVDKCVIVNPSSGVLENDIKNNDFVADVVKRWPDRFIGFAAINPLFGDSAIKEMERAINVLGLKGIKLYPPNGYPIDSPIAFPVVEKAIKMRIPITIHSDYNGKFCSPHQIARLASFYPEATLIMAHQGMDSDMYWFTPEIIKRYENVYLDSAATPDHPDVTFVYPVRELGTHRIIFGSDALPLNQAVALKKLEEAERLWGLTKEEKKHILGENIIQILGLSTAG